MNLRAHQKLIVGIALVLVANVLMAVLLFQGRLYGPQSFFNDLLLRTSNQQTDDRIVIVAIDNQSIADYGRLGSWDRAVYGNLIARLKDAGARVAAFDVYFDPPTPRDPIVAQAIAYAQSNANGSTPMPVILATVGDGQLGLQPQQGLQYQSFLPPSPLMTAAKPQLANVTVDPDGAVVRHLPLRAFAGAQHFFLLPFEAVQAYNRSGPLETQTSLKLEGNGIQTANGFVPTDQTYRMLINFEGKPFAFKHYSLSQVADGKIDPANFKDKLVFVGELGATNLVDNYPVPSSNETKMDGVEIWANGAQNILDGKFVVPEGTISTLIFMVVLSAGAIVGFFFSGALLGWLAGLGVIVVYSA
ncbi:MAG TPA: CHASE2 domain-containing protein, partial [Chloroflexota bacterium]|nr:CHASE2 domain-containing protein [Chloroflexota bacterium]